MPFARVDTVRRSLFVRAPTYVNDCVFHCQDVDIFHDSLREFRAKVSAYIKQLYTLSLCVRDSVINPI